MHEVYISIVAVDIFGLPIYKPQASLTFVHKNDQEIEKFDYEDIPVTKMAIVDEEKFFVKAQILSAPPQKPKQSWFVRFDVDCSTMQRVRTAQFPLVSEEGDLDGLLRVEIKMSGDASLNASDAIGNTTDKQESNPNSESLPEGSDTSTPIDEIKSNSGQSKSLAKSQDDQHKPQKSSLVSASTRLSGTSTGETQPSTSSDNKSNHVASDQGNNSNTIVLSIKSSKAPANTTLGEEKVEANEDEDAVDEKLSQATSDASSTKGQESKSKKDDTSDASPTKGPESKSKKDDTSDTSPTKGQESKGKKDDTSDASSTKGLESKSLNVSNVLPDQAEKPGNSPPISSNQASLKESTNSATGIETARKPPSGLPSQTSTQQATVKTSSGESKSRRNSLNQQGGKVTAYTTPRSGKSSKRTTPNSSFNENESSQNYEKDNDFDSYSEKTESEQVESIASDPNQSNQHVEENINSSKADTKEENNTKGSYETKTTTDGAKSDKPYDSQKPITNSKDDFLNIAIRRMYLFAVCSEKFKLEVTGITKDGNEVSIFSKEGGSPSPTVDNFGSFRVINTDLESIKWEFIVDDARAERKTPASSYAVSNKTGEICLPFEEFEVVIVLSYDYEFDPRADFKEAETQRKEWYQLSQKILQDNTAQQTSPRPSTDNIQSLKEGEEHDHFNTETQDSEESERPKADFISSQVSLGMSRFVIGPTRKDSRLASAGQDQSEVQQLPDDKNIDPKILQVLKKDPRLTYKCVRIRCPSCPEADGTYRGTFDGLLKHGYGIYRWDDGRTYRGDWTNDRIEGYGIYAWAKHRRPQLHLETPILPHDGNAHLAEGESGRYEGNWKWGTMHGHGVFYSDDGLIFDGTWSSNHITQGRLILSDGTKIFGNFEAEKLHGHARVQNPNGDYYDGYWRDGFRHGKGTMVWSHSKSKYEGQWAYGNMDGHGTMTVYDQESKRDITYKGEWRKGLRHGQGTQIFSEVTRFEGEWKDDVPVKGIYQDHGEDYPVNE
eukprot:TRINITY_DN2507_c0_g1_i3.p1 TRINITY_DN2507_c0_g1~~TRINITY_DN2507_c0_g1_i3.p1  ORF type:complete len:1006 (-),score=216.74 TRINITY_DN2507_c0_g1_i3:249-3266(-)